MEEGANSLVMVVQCCTSGEGKRYDKDEPLSVKVPGTVQYTLENLELHYCITPEYSGTYY